MTGSTSKKGNSVFYFKNLSSRRHCRVQHGIFFSPVIFPVKMRSHFSLSQFLGLSSSFSLMHSPSSGFSPWSEVCWSQWKSTMLVRRARISYWEKGTRFLANSSLHPLSAEADDRIIFYQDADTTHSQHKRSVISLWISSQDCFCLTLSIWYLNF